jgi:hypothetical protein
VLVPSVEVSYSCFSSLTSCKSSKFLLMAFRLSHFSAWKFIPHAARQISFCGGHGETNPLANLEMIKIVQLRVELLNLGDYCAVISPHR